MVISRIGEQTYEEEKDIVASPCRNTRLTCAGLIVVLLQRLRHLLWWSCSRSLPVFAPCPHDSMCSSSVISHVTFTLSVVHPLSPGLILHPFALSAFPFEFCTAGIDSPAALSPLSDLHSLSLVPQVHQHSPALSLQEASLLAPHPCTRPRTQRDSPCPLHAGSFPPRATRSVHSH